MYNKTLFLFNRIINIIHKFFLSNSKIFIGKKHNTKKNILFIEHHMAHAASSFLVSPFEEAAILTVDGVGEWATASYGYGKGN